MTFEDIDKMTLNQFGHKGSAFKPSDILDIDEANDSEDEILQKFKTQSRSPKKSPVGKRFTGPRGSNLA